MKEFKTTLELAASPDEVWPVLVDTTSWPQWDPFTERIEGTVALGAKLKAYSKLSPGRGFAVKVTALVPCETMVWTGGMPLGLFTGVRTYSLRARLGGGTTFTMHERYNGPLAPLITKSIPDLSQAFDAFALGLKARIERSARALAG